MHPIDRRPFSPFVQEEEKEPISSPPSPLSTEGRVSQSGQEALKEKRGEEETSKLAPPLKRARKDEKDESSSQIEAVAKERFLAPMMSDEANQRLQSALFSHDEALIIRLFQQGADPQQQFDGNRAIHVAAIQGHLQVLEYLWQIGGDLEQANDIGLTPLLLAAEAKQEAAVVWLLDKGADINGEDSEGQTLLHHMLNTGNQAMTLFCLQRGAHLFDPYGRDEAYDPLFLALCNAAKDQSKGFNVWFDCAKKIIEWLIQAHAQQCANFLFLLVKSRLPLDQWPEMVALFKEKGFSAAQGESVETFFEEAIAAYGAAHRWQIIGFLRELEFSTQELEKKIWLEDISLLIEEEKPLSEEMQAFIFDSAHFPLLLNLLKDVPALNYFHQRWLNRVQELIQRQALKNTPLSALEKLYLLPFLPPSDICKVIQQIDYRSGYSLLHQKIFVSRNRTLSYNELFDIALTKLKEGEIARQELAPIPPPVFAILSCYPPSSERIEECLEPILKDVEPLVISCLIPALSEKVWLNLMQEEGSEAYLTVATAHQKDLFLEKIGLGAYLFPKKTWQGTLERRRAIDSMERTAQAQSFWQLKNAWSMLPLQLKKVIEALKGGEALLNERLLAKQTSLVQKEMAEIEHWLKKTEKALKEETEVQIPAEFDCDLFKIPMKDPYFLMAGEKRYRFDRSSLFELLKNQGVPFIDEEPNPEAGFTFPFTQQQVFVKDVKRDEAFAQEMEQFFERHPNLKEEDA
ncbi:MAG: hypothetical protein K0S07_166 [Chlamydiales bacterium]|jgi:hypothetical protein|nr:hypothetical protein [Chlamydiales bacterium]